MKVYHSDNGQEEFTVTGEYTDNGGIKQYQYLLGEYGTELSRMNSGQVFTGVYTVLMLPSSSNILIIDDEAITEQVDLGDDFQDDLEYTEGWNEAVQEVWDKVEGYMNFSGVQQ